MGTEAELGKGFLTGVLWGLGASAAAVLLLVALRPPGPGARDVAGAPVLTVREQAPPVLTIDVPSPADPLSDRLSTPPQDIAAPALPIAPEQARTGEALPRPIQPAPAPRVLIPAAPGFAPAPDSPAAAPMAEPPAADIPAAAPRPAAPLGGAAIELALPPPTQVHDNAPTSDAHDAPAPEALAIEATAQPPARPAPIVRTDRLPRIGVGPVPETTPEPQPGAPDADAADDSLPAVLRNAARADLAVNRPLMAVILVDDLTAPEIRADLLALPFPVSVALDPLSDGAAEAALAYRAAGMEVLMLASAVPERATASDLDSMFEGFLSVLPQAVGMIDAVEGGFQNNRLLSQLLVPLLARDGHALITHARGLNAAAQVAAGVGLAQGQVFRVLDGADESVFTIRRFLDRAAFEAGREGRVLVVGHATNPDTLAALLAWRIEGRAAGVALVPVSAALIDP